MKITYDPAKRAQTLKDRGLDFKDALAIFAGPTIEFTDQRQDYGEMRKQTIGYLQARMVMVVWTPRGDARHIISMRKCNARERKNYGPRISG